MKKRSPATVAERPSWWTREEVLDCVQGGLRVGEVLDRAIADVDGKVGRRVLILDISRWCREDPVFAGQWEEAKALRKGAGFSDTWHDDFFRAMDDFDGRMEDACAFVGVKPGVVLAITDPKSQEHYNADFARRFRLVEADRHAGIRTRYYAHAEEGDNWKVQEKILEAQVGHLHGSTKELRVSGQINQNVIVGLSPEVLEASQRRTRALMAGRDPARVIDLAPLAVEAAIPCSPLPATSPTESA